MILLGLGLAAAPVENGSGQCSFDVTAIHPAPCPIWGVTPTVGTAVSEAGGVAGYHWNCNLDDRAFYWTPESGFVSIPMPANTYFSRAWGINSAGQVCGEVELIDGHLGFVYQAEKLTLIFPPAGTLVQPPVRAH